LPTAQQLDRIGLQNRVSRSVLNQKVVEMVQLKQFILSNIAR
jgi:hypothetical protein